MKSLTLSRNCTACAIEIVHNLDSGRNAKNSLKMAQKLTFLVSERTVGIMWTKIIPRRNISILRRPVRKKTFFKYQALGLILLTRFVLAESTLKIQQSIHPD